MTWTVDVATVFTQLVEQITAQYGKPVSAHEGVEHIDMIRWTYWWKVESNYVTLTIERRDRRYVDEAFQWYVEVRHRRGTPTVVTAEWTTGVLPVEDLLDLLVLAHILPRPSGLDGC